MKTDQNRQVTDVIILQCLLILFSGSCRLDYLDRVHVVAQWISTHLFLDKRQVLYLGNGPTGTVTKEYKLKITREGLFIVLFNFLPYFLYSLVIVADIKSVQKNRSDSDTKHLGRLIVQDTQLDIPIPKEIAISLRKRSSPGKIGMFDGEDVFSVDIDSRSEGGVGSDFVDSGDEGGVGSNDVPSSNSGVGSSSSSSSSGGVGSSSSGVGGDDDDDDVMPYHVTPTLVSKRARLWNQNMPPVSSSVSVAPPSSGIASVVLGSSSKSVAAVSGNKKSVAAGTKKPVVKNKPPPLLKTTSAPVSNSVVPRELGRRPLGMGKLSTPLNGKHSSVSSPDHTVHSPDTITGGLSPSTNL